MVDVVRKECNHGGCFKIPTFGQAGREPEACAEHAKEGMVDVVNKRCGHARCHRGPEFCSKHGKDGLINVRRKRTSRGSGSSGVVGAQCSSSSSTPTCQRGDPTVAVATHEDASK